MRYKFLGVAAIAGTLALGAAAWIAPGASAFAARVTRSQPYTVRSAAYRAVAGETGH